MFSMRRNRGPRGTVGLDIDGGYVAAVQLVDGRVEKAATADLPEGSVRDGEIVDAAALTRVLEDLFQANELPRAVQLGVANQQILVRQLDLPRIDDPRELEKAVRFQAAEAIAMPLDEAVLDYQVAGLIPSEGGE